MRPFRPHPISNIFCLLVVPLITLHAAGCHAQAPTAQTPVAPSPPPLATMQHQMPGAGRFANPVFDRNFPDPDVLRVGDTYYAYATNGGDGNIQTARSTDLVRWEMLPDAMPVLPSWVQPGRTWAPEVTRMGNGTFVMYFTARDKASDRQAIGVATSDKPQGPFVGQGDRAFIAQPEQGGSIDASSFADDDGSRYVLWKNDGNAIGQDTWLHIQKVSADGLTRQGEPVRLIRADQEWEGRLIEAPTLWKRNKKYYLLYSANAYVNERYAIGYAVASKLTGPYVKSSASLLVTDRERGIIGPGGQDIVLDKSGQSWLLYHAYPPQGRYRRLNLDRLIWLGNTPIVQKPSLTP